MGSDHVRLLALARRSVEARMERNALRVASGCLEWQRSTDAEGYGRIDVRYEGERRTMQAHRVAYWLAYGTLPEGLLICHHCDNPSCVDPEHLYAGTRFDNAADLLLRHGPTTRLGSQCVAAKLTEPVVRAIRAARGAESPQSLALRYAVAPATIYAVWSGQNWRHVTSEATP